MDFSSSNLQEEGATFDRTNQGYADLRTAGHYLIYSTSNKMKKAR
ncbi:hypothetical protein AB9P05_05160 [Roseivirga sp. BDSF3-8]